MLDFNLIKLVLISALASSIITTACVQKVKENMKSKKYLTLISFGISMIIGTLFSYCFSDLSLVNNLWSGFITFLGADLIYNSFEDKIFKPFSKMQEVVEIPKSQIKTFKEVQDEIQ